MRKSDFYPKRDMTKEDVLAAIRDSYRFAERLDPEAEPGYELSLQSTVADWRNACDLLPTRELGHALNSWFNVPFSDLEWRSVLEPAKTARLGPVCELIASWAQAPTVSPYKILGTECWSAGAFLTIRSALSGQGIPAGDISPSTPLVDVAHDHLEAMVSVMGRVSPGALSVPEINYGIVCRLGRWCFLIATLTVLASPWVHNLAYVSVAAIVISFLAVRHSAKQALRAARFGDLVTFRDLANAVFGKVRR
jgi:hypothetical protein